MADPEATVGLSEALIALRQELITAWKEGEGPGQRMRFRVPEPIELTIQAAVSKNLGGEAGIKWWLLTLGAKGSRELTATQTLTLKLAPVMYDDNDQLVDLVEIDDNR
jgi:hypothetical protein